MVLQLAKPIQTVKPTISNRNNNESRRAVLYRVNGRVDRAPETTTTTSPGVSLGEQKWNELLGLGYEQYVNPDGTITLRSGLSSYYANTRDSRNERKSYFYKYEYIFGSDKTLLKNIENRTYNYSISSSGVEADQVYQYRVYDYDQFQRVIKFVDYQEDTDPNDSRGEEIIWKIKEVNTTYDDSANTMLENIYYQPHNPKKNPPPAEDYLNRFEFLEGGSKTKYTDPYTGQVFIVPTGAKVLTPAGFYDTAFVKNSFYQFMQESKQQKNYLFDREDIIPVTPYSGQRIEISHAFAEKMNQQSLREDARYFVNYFKEPKEQKISAKNPYNDFIELRGDEFGFIADMSVREDKTVTVRKSSLEPGMSVDYLIKDSQKGFWKNLLPTSASLGKGLLKTTVLFSPHLRKYGRAAGYSLEDKDIKNFTGEVSGVKDLGVSLAKGFGKQAYFFADVTLVRAFGSKTRDKVLPAFSWEEADRRKNNKGVGSWAGKYDIALDRDVQTALTAEVIGITAWAGGSTGVFVAESLGVFAGGKEIYEGVANQESGKIGPGLLMLIAGRPIKKASRPFKELIFERVPTSEIFADVAGTKVTASSLKESVDLFNKGTTKMIGQAKSDKIEVVHISDRPFKEYGKSDRKYVKVGFGAKGAAGIEDAGLFAGSKGRGNVMFSGIPGTATYEGYTINPFANLRVRPTANKIYIDSVARQPRRLINRPGFIDEARTSFFNEKVRGTGFGIITKRSEIGQGTVKRQFFNVLQDIKLRSVEYLKGQKVRESGTSEIELGILPGETLRSKRRASDLQTQRMFGFRYYTRYGAKKVPFTNFEIPLTGEFVRVKEYNLMKWRASKGFAGKRDIWTDKVSKNKRFEKESLEKASSKSVMKSKIYYPTSLMPSSKSSGSFSKFFSRISGQSSKSSSKSFSKSSASMSLSTKSSRASGRNSSTSSSGSKSFGSSYLSSKSSRVASRRSSNRSSSSFKFGKSSSKPPKKSKSRLLSWERPKNYDIGLYKNYREFKVDSKMFFGVEVD